MDHNLDLLLSELTSALGGRTPAEAQAQPQATPPKWSVLEIVEHLHLTYGSTIELLQSRIEKGRPTLTRPTVSQRVWKPLILNLGYIPHGRKAPAHAVPVLPLTIRSGDELAKQVSVCLLELDALTSRGEKIFGDLPAASHSILGPLTMAEWRRFHLVHGRHHLKQIRAILKNRPL